MIDRATLQAFTEILARELRERVRRAQAALDSTGATKIGFCLLLFDVGEKGFISYASDAERAGMIDTLRELLATWEAGLMTDPPGPRGTT